MTHSFTVSTAAAARLLLNAARISTTLVTLVADVVEGRIDPDSLSWNEFGAEGVALADELRRAIRRSQSARKAACARRSATPASATPAANQTSVPTPSTPTDETPVDVPFEMRRTSRGMEKFYRWPDRSWRRNPPTADDVSRLSKRGRRRR